MGLKKQQHFKKEKKREKNPNEAVGDAYISTVIIIILMFHNLCPCH
jgi:hypothetical protein